MKNAWGLEFPDRNQYFSISGVEEYLRTALATYMRGLGVDKSKSPQLIEQVIALASETADDMVYLTSLRELLFNERSIDTITSSRDSRASTVITQISPFINGNRILDLGSGDGAIARMLSKETGADIVCADIFPPEERLSSVHGFHLIDPSNNSIDLPDSIFDTVSILSVAHHAEDPQSLLKEGIRLLKQGGRIVLIEVIFDPETSPTGNHAWDDKMTQEFMSLDLQGRLAISCFIDELANTAGWSPDIKHPIGCPFNFNSVRGWRDFLADQAIVDVDILSMGVDQPLGAGICHGLISGIKR